MTKVLPIKLYSLQCVTPWYEGKKIYHLSDLTQVPSLTSQYPNLNEYSLRISIFFSPGVFILKWEVLIWVYHSLVDCPPGMEYQMCGLSIHCHDLRVVRDCRNSTCESGCFCSNGTVLEDGVCVHHDICPSKIIWHCLLSDRDYIWMIFY